MEIIGKRREVVKCSSNSPDEEHLKDNLKVTSLKDTEHFHSKQPLGGTVLCANESSHMAVPCRPMVRGARSAQEILAMQPSEMDKKREAFLEHLKQKYPQHASVIMGHQERLREQCLQGMLSSLQCELNIQRYLLKTESLHQPRNQSARAGVLCSSLVPLLRDQPDLGSLVSLDTLEVMSECEVPVAFTRGSRSRASLPVVRSANQTKDRSLDRADGPGHSPAWPCLTRSALGRLGRQTAAPPGSVVLPWASCGVLYLQYGDDTKQIRMPNEITTVDTVQALFVSAFPQQLSMKMLESPSTAIYVKDDMRNMYYELSDVRSITDQSCLKVYHKDPAHAFSHAARPSNGDARMHREAMYTSRDAPPLIRQTSNSPSMPPTPHSVTALPSRIPFGLRSSGGGATMPRERAGHPLATPTRSASPCPSAILERRDVKPDEDVSAKGMGRGGEGIYSDPFLLHHHAPPSETLDQGYHRASLRSYGISGMAVEPTEHHSLFRQKSWKTPPPSPHRMGEMRIIDIQASQSQGTLGLERSSPVRQSFRKEGPIAVDKGRSTMGSPVTSDIQGHGLPAPSVEPQTRDRSVKSGSPVHSTSSTGGSSPVLGTKMAKVTPESNSVPTHPVSTIPLQVNLLHFRKNISELRLQLQQMRQLQLQNQESVRAQIKQVEQEISARLAEVLRQQEDPAQRQRALVEEERHKYLRMEESVLTQLGDLEQYVESVRRDSNAATAVRAITLKEVEEGAIGLRKVGESLAALKGDFPTLQGRMRAVLRVEVEAVKFLKEEPHKLDSMLKRVKSLTETLSTLRRCATEGLLKSSDSVTTVVDEGEPAPPADLHSTITLLEPQKSSLSSEVVNSQPLLSHCGQSSYSPASELPTKQISNTRHVETCSSAQPEHAPPLSSSSGVTLSCNVTRCNGAPSSGTSSLFIEEIISHSKGKNRAPSIEAAEKEWEEKRHSMCHYDGLEFEKMLQEAEANMLRGIPSMDVSVGGGILPSPAAAPPSTSEERVEKPKPSAPPTQEDKQPERPSSEKSTKSGPDKAPKPQVEKAIKTAVLSKPVKPNLSIKTSLERPPKSQDKATKTSQSSDKANKSPPPPPPRRNYINSTGVTTTRSGEVIYTCRKESGSAQEDEVDAPNPVPQHKPRSSPEVKPKPCTPLPVTASAILEEEDEGDKIMAELQVFQKCLVKDIELKGSVEPQIKELRSGALLPLKDKKQNTEIQENKDLVMDENGNNAVRQNTGVIYYVTAQITKEPPEESTDHRAASQSTPSQVSHVSTNEKSQNKLLVSSDGLSGIPGHGPDNIWSLSSDLPYKPLTCSSSMKTKEPGPGSPTQGKVHVVKVPQVQLSIEETVESPTAICSPVSLGGPDLIHCKVPATHGELSSTNQQQVFSLPKTRESKYKEVEDESDTFLSPDLPGEEPPPPPDNIAFMITNTKVQALSTGEYQELVNAKSGNVQTVTVGSNPQTKHGSDISTVSCSNGLADAENGEFSKKPVIIIFDEPMDIRSAYKRLSTIFECEEELERMLAEERIEEESEEMEDEDKRNGGVQVAKDGDKMNSGKIQNGANLVLSSSRLSDGETQATSDAKPDVKKKFKLKFPKKQLAALTQAIRTGTKTGKKTLQVVVYEDEEESDGTIKQHKETKRFEISCSKQDNSKSESVAQEPRGRTEEIRKNTYKTLDSLEQTIKQLETTITEMGPRSSDDLLTTEYSKPHDSQGAEASAKVVPQKTLVTKPSNSSKRPSLRKKPKPQLLPRPAVITTTGTSVTPAPPQQNVSVAPPTSRMPVPMSAKTRQQPGTSDRERATKQLKLQDSQRQFRQANGSAKRSGGDPKSTSPTMPASKIPAFSSSAGKGASQPDATNPVNNSAVFSSSSSSKSSIPNPRSIPSASSHIPSLSNGSVKIAQSTHNTKSLSLSTQTQNGRYSSSSSSSSHSPLSPTMLSQGSKSIRTIHTPSFISYSRPHNGKSAIPTAASTKEAS
ncbi:sickle tail protein homolog isoform X7 [Neoarius graeffei]|uniref:sickle tail protein homolog isoform X7 n=1 Tax=Neoarius graeffei TaxID=443677 RepID=UPI00298D1B59|nr:sickle tail protein homolog isoform X7 [Neoarius graeffei]